MMFLVLDEIPTNSVNYLLEHTNEKYLKKQILELFQLICSAGYSNVYKKIPQGKEIQDWIKCNEAYVWCYLNYALAKIYTNKNIGIPEKYSQIFNDFTHNMNITFSKYKYYPIPETAIFRYQKQYNSETPTNTELPIKIAIKEYKKYLKWKIEQNKNYFKGSIEC